MELRYTTGFPAKDDLYALYENLGWNDFLKISPEQLLIAMKQSWYSIMLEVAEKEYCHPCVEYFCMDMSELSVFMQKFDVVYLIYSQEHPIVTATMECKSHHNMDKNGSFISYTFSDYAKSGQRVGPWFVDGVINYQCM